MKKEFRELKAWAKDLDIEVQVDSTYYHYAQTKSEDRIVNGIAGCDGSIVLYCDKDNVDWSYMVSMLIHEIGHVILFQDGVSWHSEKDAWICGITVVPDKFKHDKLKDHCIECLRSYDYKKFGWLDDLL